MIYRRVQVLLLFLFSAAIMFAGNYEEGKTYSGFKLLKKKFVNEVNAECYYFQHEKSGAHLFKIAADDANKTFSVTFKTPPNSDCGTPHIMEHSVLNGSKNFPVKSPFDVLSQGSLNTFLNALTSSDWTMYPIASMNDKDYFNLMHVYLDAVFNPLIYTDSRILKQEGWHHEMETPDGNVTYKGVVYNEMKGAFSSPTRELDYQINKNLFPDNCYQYSSGGYPAAIPLLTNEAFIDFHKRYYHPSNSHIFLYGNGNLAQELEFIDKEYLSGYGKGEGKAEIPLQKPFAKMKEVSSFYPVTEGSETEDQTYLSLSFVSGKNTDRAHVMALQILAEVLVNSESAPVKTALQKAGIGKDVSAFIDENQQNNFSIVVQNANAGDKENFYRIVVDALNQAADKGLDKETVEGTLNRMEFELREGNDAQKGLSYNFAALPGWLFVNDPFLCLEYEAPLAQVKADLSAGILERMIRTEFTGNPFSLLMVMEPQPGLEKVNLEKQLKELEDYKNSLTPEEKEQLVKETKELVEYQQRADAPEALETIPMLELGDINPNAEWYGIEEKQESGVKILEYEAFTNNVLYTQLFFDLRVLPQELIPYAALLSEMIGKLDTKNYTYQALDNALNLHTGGFRTFLTTYMPGRSESSFLPYMVIDSKSMYDKTGKMIDLLAEIVNSTKFDDKERIKAVLDRHFSRIDGRIKQDGLNYAMTRSLSYFSKSSLFNELTGGYEYYMFISDLTDNFDQKFDEISASLSRAAGLIFNKNNMMLALTCDEAGQKEYFASLPNLINSIKEEPADIKNWDLKLDKKNEGLLSASKVQYVIQGYDFSKLGYNWTGKMQVLQQIVSSDWLQNQIRVIGGAYGGWCRFNPYGIAYFASYRDPNLKETIDNFAGTPAYLDKFEADDKQMLRFIIGTIADIDRPLTALQKGNTAVRYHMEGVTAADLQRERDEVLSTTTEEIRAMKKLVEDVLAEKSYCVYGNQEKLESEKSLFNSLLKISK